MSKLSICSLPLISALLMLLAACDEGRLYPEEPVMSQSGGTASFCGKIIGLDSWPEDYAIALAGFKTGNDFALISKNIKITSKEEINEIILSGIPAEATTIELCAIDRLRRRVATFAQTDYSGDKDTARLLISRPLDISIAQTIQRDILNTTCANCHGGSNHPAAGLNLTAGHSFQELIGVESKKVKGSMRVMPGQSEESLLYRIFAYGESTDWNYDHSVEIVRQEKLDLLKSWIDEGAKY